MDDKKKLIILAVLMVVAVTSIIYGLSAPAKGKRGAVARAGAARQYEGVQKASVVAGPEQRRAVKSKIASWRRSPFAPKSAGAEGISGLAFNGIITDGKVLKAVIGDTIVKKGDRVSGCTMVDIKKDSIVVNDGTGNRELKLER